MGDERDETVTWQIDGRQLELHKLDRVLWPQEGYTKGVLLTYYRDIAPIILPYLRQRPLTFGAFPRGVDGPRYYRRSRPKSAPDWLRAVRYQPASRSGDLEAPLIDDAAGLLWYVEHGAIEFHIWLTSADDLDRPDWAVFDLDPGDKASFAQVLQTASLVQNQLESQDLTGYVKTSGGRGLHVFVPLAPAHPFPAVREWVRGIAEILAESHPDLVAVAQRETHSGRLVTIDHAQNSVARNTAAPYTVRGHPGARVSAPVSWDEVAAGTLRPSDFTLATMPDRLTQVGDLWEPALTLEQRLPA